MNYVKRTFYIIMTAIIVFMIYRVSILLLMVGFEQAASELLFITLSIYLLIPLVKNFKFKDVPLQNIEINRRIKKAYESISDKDTTALIGLTLKEGNITTDIDSIIINKYGVFNIAFCNYSGNIKIKDGNTWVKVNRKDQEEKLESPIDKIRDSRKTLSNIYDEEIIIDLIIMTNSWAQVEEESVSSVPILFVEEIDEYISNYQTKEKYDEDELYDLLYPLISKEKDLEKDFDIYEKYLDIKWQYRSRIAIISFALMFYIFRIIGIK